MTMQNELPTNLPDQIRSSIEHLRSNGIEITIDAETANDQPGDKSPEIPDLASSIEHSLLTPEATLEAIQKLCREAIQFNFCGVCVNPVYVSDAKKWLASTKSIVVSVIGFPLGSNLTATKTSETKRVIEAGANEVDMVLHIGALKSGEYLAVERDIRSVVEAADGTPVKVIIETGLLSNDEKIQACLLAMSAGATFVKTSTGFSKSGATAADVKLMKAVVGSRLQVKASGGIRDLKTAETMLRAGASRLGCSSSVKIMRQATNSTT